MGPLLTRRCAIGHFAVAATISDRASDRALHATRSQRVRRGERCRATGRGCALTMLFVNPSSRAAPVNEAFRAMAAKTAGDVYVFYREAGPKDDSPRREGDARSCDGGSTGRSHARRDEVAVPRGSSVPRTRRARRSRGRY
jgi:hypothetical protein